MAQQKFDPRRVEIPAREPVTRSYLHWDVHRVRAAVTLAEAGSMALFGRLADDMREDDRVAAALGTRVGGLLGLNLSFAPADESSRASEVAQALAEDWPAIAESLYELVLLGLWCGAVPVALRWLEHNGRWVPVLDPWSPQWLVWSDADGTWTLQLPGRRLELQGGVWWLWSPGGKRPWRGAVARSCIVPWLAKVYAVQDWARYNEVHGTPTRVGTAPAGAPDEQRDRLARDLQELGAVTSLVLPEGWSMELLEAQASTWESFRAQIEWADRALAVAILGQHLTTEVRGASLAAARVHDQVRADLIAADASRLSEGLRSGVLRWWAEANWGAPDLAPWPTWDTTHPDEGRARAQRLFDLGRAVMVWSQAGVPLDVDALAEQEGVPLARRQAPVQAHRTVRLASGDRPSRARGFITGQLYADQLGERTARLAADVLDRDLAAVQRAVQGARDYDDLRQRLLAVFGQMDPTELAEIVERALLLGDLAGRWAVWHDAPEAREQTGGTTEGSGS